MVDDGNRFSFKLLLLAASLAAYLILSLVQPAQAREEAAIITIQAVEPKTPTVGHSLTFAVIVENNSVAQRIGVEDFLPSGVSWVSARPSQGTCDIRRGGSGGWGGGGGGFLGGVKGGG